MGTAVGHRALRSSGSVASSTTPRPGGARPTAGAGRRRGRRRPGACGRARTCAAPVDVVGRPGEVVVGRGAGVGQRGPGPGACGRASRRVSSSTPPSSTSTPPRSRLSNTNGTSMAWQAPSTPPMAVDGRSKRYMRHVGRVRQLGLGQPHRRHAEDRGRSSRRTQQAVGVGAPAGRAVEVDHVVDPVVADQAGDAAPQLRSSSEPAEAGLEVEQVPLVGGGADDQRDAGGAAGADGLEGRPGEQPRRRPPAGTCSAADRRAAGGRAPRWSARRSTSAWAAQHRVDGQATSTPSTVAGERSSAPSTSSVTRSASPGGGCARRRRSGRWPGGTGPRPPAWPRSVPTLMPPADSPKIVTLPGSPPKPAMLSRTHSSAATWSRMPLLPEPANAAPRSAEVEEAEHAQPVVDRDDDDVAVPGEGSVPSYQGTSSRSRRRTPPPWIHTITGRAPSSAAGVKTLRIRQSSPDGRSCPPEHRLGRRRVLRGDRTERRGVADAGPRLDAARRPEALGPGVGDAPELVDAPLLEPLHLAGERVDDHTGRSVARRPDPRSARKQAVRYVHTDLTVC